MTLSLLKVKTICAAMLSILTTGCGTLDAIVSSGKAGATISITSNPSGADLYVMGKHAGTTPMKISNLDIYPVSYDLSNEMIYGMVFLRKDGCEEYSRRLTRSDINNGLTAVLNCGANVTSSLSLQPVAVPSTSPAVTTDVPAHAPAQQPRPVLLSLPERRLQQLKSLQQLHDEGLISDEEEKKMRRRILDAPLMQQEKSPDL